VIVLVIVMVGDGRSRRLRRTGAEKDPHSVRERVVGRKIYGGQSTHLPLRVNSGGVIPVIFAASIVSIPSTLAW